MATLQTAICFVLYIIFTATITNAKTKRLVTSLILRESMSSRHHILHNVTEASTSRHRIFHNVTEASTKGIRTPVLSRDYTFLVNFFIGKPGIPQLALIDTGSTVLWVKCVACSGCPGFNPVKSSTYVPKSCTPDCQRCDTLFGLCQYRVDYVDGTHSAGNLAYEKLTFQTPDYNNIALYNVEFGCSHEHIGFHGYTGIMGLGVNSIMLKTLGQKFSYCFGSINDLEYKFNQLSVGEDSVMQGYSTPLEVIDEHYYLTMEGISVGGKMLDIDPAIFQNIPGNYGGTIIDSGSEYSWLVNKACKKLRREVRKVICESLKRYYGLGWELCYHGAVERDLRTLPEVTFHFADGAELNLGPTSLFKQYSDYFCLAVGLSSVMGLGNLSIVGILAQQYQNMGYDLKGRKLYIQNIDCELLED